MKDAYIPIKCGQRQVVPFSSPQDAWFWFMQAHEAANNGARFTGGQGDTERPCEPADIISVAYRLYKQRRLLMDHMRVLAHYGHKLEAPNPQRPREQKAYDVWQEAMSRLAPALQSKGIVAEDFGI